MQIMAASKKYSDEFRRHALRMVGEIHDEGVDQSDAVERVADLLSMPLRTLREWVVQAELQPEPQTFDAPQGG